MGGATADLQVPGVGCEEPPIAHRRRRDSAGYRHESEKRQDCDAASTNPCGWKQATSSLRKMRASGISPTIGMTCTFTSPDKPAHSKNIPRPVTGFGPTNPRHSNGEFTAGLPYRRAQISPSVFKLHSSERTLREFYFTRTTRWHFTIPQQIWGCVLIVPCLCSTSCVLAM